jgi:hypothetical protein
MRFQIHVDIEVFGGSIEKIPFLVKCVPSGKVAFTLMF